METYVDEDEGCDDERTTTHDLGWEEWNRLRDTSAAVTTEGTRVGTKTIEKEKEGKKDERKRQREVRRGAPIEEQGETFSTNRKHLTNAWLPDVRTPRWPRGRVSTWS
eukprot:scaffold7_cov414-Pavlova_lutheri.AAC.2